MAQSGLDAQQAVPMIWRFLMSAALDDLGGRNEPREKMKRSERLPERADCQ